MYLSVYRECAESILSVYGEYGKCRVVCGTQNFLQIRGKNLCVHGEEAKRLLAYSPNTPRDIKV